MQRLLHLFYLLHMMRVVHTAVATWPCTSLFWPCIRVQVDK